MTYVEVSVPNVTIRNQCLNPMEFSLYWVLIIEHVMLLMNGFFDEVRC